MTCIVRKSHCALLSNLSFSLPAELMWEMNISTVRLQTEPEIINLSDSETVPTYNPQSSDGIEDDAMSTLTFSEPDYLKRSQMSTTGSYSLQSVEDTGFAAFRAIQLCEVEIDGSVLPSRVLELGLNDNEWSKFVEVRDFSLREIARTNNLSRRSEMRGGMTLFPHPHQIVTLSPPQRPVSEYVIAIRFSTSDLTVCVPFCAKNGMKMALCRILSIYLMSEVGTIGSAHFIDYRMACARLCYCGESPSGTMLFEKPGLSARLTCMMMASGCKWVQMFILGLTTTTSVENYRNRTQDQTRQ